MEETQQQPAVVTYAAEALKMCTNGPRCEKPCCGGGGGGKEKDSTTSKDDSSTKTSEGDAKKEELEEIQSGEAQEREKENAKEKYCSAGIWVGQFHFTYNGRIKAQAGESSVFPVKPILKKVSHEDFESKTKGKVKYANLLVSSADSRKNGTKQDTLQVAKSGTFYQTNPPGVYEISEKGELVYHDKLPGDHVLKGKDAHLTKKTYGGEETPATIQHWTKYLMRGRHYPVEILVLKPEIASYVDTCIDYWSTAAKRAKKNENKSLESPVQENKRSVHFSDKPPRRKNPVKKSPCAKEDCKKLAVNKVERTEWCKKQLAAAAKKRRRTRKLPGKKQKTEEREEKTSKRDFCPECAKEMQKEKERVSKAAKANVVASFFKKDKYRKDKDWQGIQKGMRVPVLRGRVKDGKWLELEEKPEVTKKIESSALNKVKKYQKWEMKKYSRGYNWKGPLYSKNDFLQSAHGKRGAWQLSTRERWALIKNKTGSYIPSWDWERKRAFEQQKEWNEILNDMEYDRLVFGKNKYTFEQILTLEQDRKWLVSQIDEQVQKMREQGADDNSEKELETLRQQLQRLPTICNRDWGYTVGRKLASKAKKMTPSFAKSGQSDCHPAFAKTIVRMIVDQREKIGCRGGLEKIMEDRKIAKMCIDEINKEIEDEETASEREEEKGRKHEQSQ